MLVHEGAPDHQLRPRMDDAGTPGATSSTSISPTSTPIVSGHTHLAYNCAVPGRGAGSTRAAPSRSARWCRPASTARTSTSCSSRSTRATGEVSALTVRPSDGEDAAFQPLYPADPAVDRASSTKAADRRATCSARQVARQDRRRRSTGRRPSTPPAHASRTAAASRRSATWWPRCSAGRPRSLSPASAQIAFMNPGGLRADMVGTDPGDGSYPRNADLHSRPRTSSRSPTRSINIKLTGAQIKTVLEQQWQRNGARRRAVAAVPAARRLGRLHVHLHAEGGHRVSVPTTRPPSTSR